MQCNLSGCYVVIWHMHWRHVFLCTYMLHWNIWTVNHMPSKQWMYACRCIIMYHMPGGMHICDTVCTFVSGDHCKPSCTYDCRHQIQSFGFCVTKNMCDHNGLGENSHTKYVYENTTCMATYSQEHFICILIHCLLMEITCIGWHTCAHASLVMTYVKIYVLYFNTHKVWMGQTKCKHFLCMNTFLIFYGLFHPCLWFTATQKWGSTVDKTTGSYPCSTSTKILGKTQTCSTKSKEKCRNLLEYDSLAGGYQFSHSSLPEYT